MFFRKRHGDTRNVELIPTDELLRIFKRRTGLRHFTTELFDLEDFGTAIEKIELGDLDEALIYLERSCPDLEGLRVLVARKLKGA